MKKDKKTKKKKKKKEKKERNLTDCGYTSSKQFFFSSFGFSGRELIFGSRPFRNFFVSKSFLNASR